MLMSKVTAGVFQPIMPTLPTGSILLQKRRDTISTTEDALPLQEMLSIPGIHTVSLSQNSVPERVKSSHLISQPSKILMNPSMYLINQVSAISWQETTHKLQQLRNLLKIGGALRYILVNARDIVLSTKFIMVQIKVHLSALQATKEKPRTSGLKTQQFT